MTRMRRASWGGLRWRATGSRFRPIITVMSAIVVASVVGAIPSGAAPGDSATVFQGFVPTGGKCADTKGDSDLGTKTQQGPGGVEFNGDAANLNVAAGIDGTVLVGDSYWLRRLSLNPPQLTTIAGAPGAKPSYPRPLVVAGSDPLQVGLSLVGLAVDPAARYAYIASSSEFGLQILRLSLTASAPKMEVVATDPNDLGSGRRALAVDLQNNVYVTQPPRGAQAGRVGVAVGGQVQDKIALPGTYGPTDVATDKDGHIYVAAADGSVRRYDEDGKSFQPLGLPLTTGKNGAPIGRLAVDLQGKTLVAGRYTGTGELYQVDLATPDAFRTLPGPPAITNSISIRTSDPAVIYEADVGLCSIRRFEPLGPAAAPTTQPTSPASTTPATTPTTVPQPSPPGTLPVPTATGSGASNGFSTGPVGDGGTASNQAGGGVPDGGSFFAGGQTNSAAGSGFANNFTFTPPGTPNQVGVFGPDAGFTAAPNGGGATGIVAPPAGPPSPGPSPGLGQITGAPPPLGGGPLNPSPGLGAAPGQPAYPATRYAMVRSTGGGLNPVPIGLFGLGGCMVLAAIGVAVKGDRGGPQRAPAPAPAKAWGVGP